MIRIGAVQIDCLLGDIVHNVEKQIEFIGKADKENIDVLLFPELSCCGYLLEDRVKEIALTQEDLLQLFKKIKAKMVVSVGYVERDHAGRIFNAQATIDLHKHVLLNNTRKINLPTYGMFDELRHFNPGEELHSFNLNTDNLKVATIICEDMWHPALPISTCLDYDNIPTILFAPAASPSRGYSSSVPNNIEGWEKNISFYATALGSIVINAHRVGVEDSFIFSGHSMIAFPDGSVKKAPLFEEAILSTELDMIDIISKRQKTMVISSRDCTILKQNLKEV